MAFCEPTDRLIVHARSRSSAILINGFISLNYGISHTAALTRVCDVKVG